MKDDQFEQLLQQKLAALPGEMQPQRDLWPGIDLALEDQVPNTNKPVRWIGIAASIAVLGLLGLLSFNNVTTPNFNQTELSQLVNRMSEQHDGQKKFLMAHYKQQPALTENWQQQLQELDDAAAVIMSALEKDPSDANLIKLLQRVYQQQIKLIQSVHQPNWI